MKLNNKETEIKRKNNGYQTAIKLTYNGFNLKILKRLKRCLKFTRQIKQDPYFKEIIGNRFPLFLLLSYNGNLLNYHYNIQFPLAKNK